MPEQVTQTRPIFGPNRRVSQRKLKSANATFSMTGLRHHFSKLSQYTNIHGAAENFIPQNTKNSRVAYRQQYQPVIGKFGDGVSKDDWRWIEPTKFHLRKFAQYQVANHLLGSTKMLWTGSTKERITLLGLDFDDHETSDHMDRLVNCNRALEVFREMTGWQPTALDSPGGINAFLLLNKERAKNGTINDNWHEVTRLVNAEIHRRSIDAKLECKGKIAIFNDNTSYCGVQFKMPFHGHNPSDEQIESFWESIESASINSKQLAECLVRLQYDAEEEIARCRGAATELKAVALIEPDVEPRPAIHSSIPNLDSEDALRRYWQFHFWLANKLGRWPTVIEALDNYRGHHSGRWEENEAQRRAKFTQIHAYAVTNDLKPWSRVSSVSEASRSSLWHSIYRLFGKGTTWTHSTKMGQPVKIFCNQQMLLDAYWLWHLMLAELRTKPSKAEYENTIPRKRFFRLREKLVEAGFTITRFSNYAWKACIDLLCRVGLINCLDDSFTMGNGIDTDGIARKYSLPTSKPKLPKQKSVVISTSGSFFSSLITFLWYQPRKYFVKKDAVAEAEWAKPPPRGSPRE